MSEPPSRAASTGREPNMVRSAGVLGIGNVASRLLGLAREMVISGYFGSSAEVSVFRLAARVPNMVFDLLVGGMLSAALVPVFSDYARPERRHEMARAASAIISLIAIAMAVIVLLIELFARPLAGLLQDFDDPAMQHILARSLRVIAPAILFFGLSGAVTGLLYSLKRFTYTAFGGAVFNLGIVICAPLLSRYLGIYALPLGVVLGSVIQLMVMLPGLRDLGMRLTAGWDHPAVRRILRLYLPIALGLIVSEFQIIVDGRWASATGGQSVAWMGYATTLIQLPLGLVPVAVSLAALPSMAQRASAGDWEGYRAIFGRGLRLVLVLLTPAVIGLWVLATPVVGVVFEHGQFSSADTAMTALALRLYLLGLLFAGVDFLLNYTFYARQDTRTPAIVGMVSVGAYFVAALMLKPRYGFLGLVLADSVKQACHATIMGILFLLSVGHMRGYGVWRTLLSSVLAALAMGGCLQVLMGQLPASFLAATGGRITGLMGLAAAGLALYVIGLRLLRVPEMTDLLRGVGARLRRTRQPDHP